MPLNKIYKQYQLEKREIDLVICHVLGINTAQLFIFEKEIDKPQLELIKKHLLQREQGMPFAYITGNKQFWNLELKVNQHTLIPRPETELLIELILKHVQNDFTGNILDLGTGTGAIALNLAQQLPKANITAVDYSKECIQIAQHNKEKYNLNNIRIIQSNWFENISDSYDIIVSNPPYIAEDDRHLKQLKFEPISALTAKQNGLADLKHIIINAKNFLLPNGYLLLEHGYNQHQDVQKELSKNNYNKISSHKDIAQIYRATAAFKN